MKRNRPWVIIFLIAITGLVFGRACLCEFTIWDDHQVLCTSPQFNPPTLANACFFWGHTYYTLYLPLTCTLWEIMAAAGWSEQADTWGNHLNPYLFHGVNIVLHIACVLAVWKLIRRLVASDLAAGIGTLLFAIHPVQAEPVAWVIGTRDLLGTLFSTLAILAYLNFRDSPDGRERFWKSSLATVLFVAALLSKPTAVVTPAMAALICFWEPRRWQKSEWAVLAAWFVIAAIDAISTRITQSVDPMMLRAQPGLWFRTFVAVDSLAFYCGKLLAPINLGIDYGRTPSYLLASGQWKWTWIIPAFLAAGFVKLDRQFRICAGIFVICLLPLLGLTPFQFQVYHGTVSDRYLYPSMIGLSLAAALAWSKIGKKSMPFFLAGATAGCLTLSALTFHQLSFWRDSMALFTRAIEANPRTFAGYQNRGAVENHDGDFEAAMADFQALIALDPNAPEGYRGLARAEMGLGHDKESIANWSTALGLEKRTISLHGAMSPQFHSQLANSFTEAATYAARAARPDLAQRWREQASRELIETQK